MPHGNLQRENFTAFDVLDASEYLRGIQVVQGTEFIIIAPLAPIFRGVLAK